MNSDLSLVLLAYAGVFFLTMALLAMLFVLFFSFAKTGEIENIVGSAGSAIQVQKGLWGNGPIGRLVRANYLAAFFFWRQVPGFGQTIAAKFGDVQAVVPWKLRRWVIIPMSVFWFSMITFFIVGGFFNWWQTGSPMG